MTDNEIIKSMQCVIGNDVKCSECTYQKVLPFPSCRRKCAKNALDLINRQKAIIEKSEKVERFADKTIETANAEIERLKSENKSIRYCYEQAKAYNNTLAESCEKNCKKFNMTTRAEAIKEFAHFIIDRSRNGVIYASDILDLVKEMTEVNEK